MLNYKTADCILVEQYFLAACLEYHQHNGHNGSQAFKDVTIQCLFDSPESAYSPAKAKQVGYTHLLGYAKKDAALAQRLEQRVATTYPLRYQHCVQQCSSVKPT